MPNDTIKRAIQKGTGELGAESYEELVYEVYGPGGTAVVVEILTDNRNRTAGEIRKLLEQGHAKLAASGSVLYLFHKKGHIVVREGRSARTRSWRRRSRRAPTTCAPRATVSSS